MSVPVIQTVLAVKAVPGADLLARHLGVPRRAVEPRQGGKGRLKRFVVAGLDAAEPRTRVAAGLA